MRRPDPRVMLLMAACFSTLGVLIETTWLLACIFAFTVLFVSALGAKMLPLVKRLRGILYIVLFIALMESIFRPQGYALIKIGTLDILTAGGLLRGANTMLRMAVVIASASVFTLTSSRSMIQGLIQLKIPYEFAFMSSVALRFLPVFSEEFRDTVTAIQLRGVDIKRIPLKEKLKIYTAIVSPVVYGAVDKAEKLSYSMELRAFRAYPIRSSRFTLKLGAADYAYIVAIPALTAAVLCYYYIFI